VNHLTSVIGRKKSGNSRNNPASARLRDAYPGRRYLFNFHSRENDRVGLMYSDRPAG